MGAMTFRHEYRVTYADCTLGNHIYYGRYLDLLEEARGEFFRLLGASFLHWQEKGTIFPIIECRIRYKSPARYDDLLSTELWLTVAERVRLNFAYRITNQNGATIVEAQTQHICTGLSENPRRLPEDLTKLLHPYLLAPPKPLENAAEEGDQYY